MSDEELTIGGRLVRLTSPERLMFPEDGITKADLVAYYRRIAPVMLPHMAGRPVSMERYPEGLGGPRFFHKEAPEAFPEWIARASVTVLESGEVQPQVVCDSEATLAYLANQGCITPHIWLSRIESAGRPVPRDYPDRLIFDLDPPGDDFELARRAAGDLAAMLRELGLVPFLMTTGSRGLHVAVPLDGAADFDAVRAFARRLAERLAGRSPQELTTETRKDARQGRLFLDYLRNAYAQTTVAPYSVRARPGAPVATPLEWDELQDPRLSSRRYTTANIFRRLGQRADPWEGIGKHARSLQEAERRLGAPA
jgi:bifunctional non-homologous end joining protein LigD